MGGAPAEHVEHWKAPEITVHFKVHRSYLQETIQHRQQKRPPIIEGQTRANTEAVKWYLSLNMNFCKPASPGVKTDPAIMFHLEVFNSIDTHELDYQFHVGYNEIVLQIDEFQRSGSGWVVDHLQHFDLSTCFL